MQLVQDVRLEQLLIGNTHLDRISTRAVLVKPRVDERNVDARSRVARAQIERSRCEQERDTIRRVFRVQIVIFQQRFDFLR